MPRTKFKKSKRTKFKKSKRTKFKKSKRTKYAPPNVKTWRDLLDKDPVDYSITYNPHNRYLCKRTKRKGITISNLGGYMMDPPENCHASRIVQDRQGFVWVDLAFCVSCPLGVRRCERRKSYYERCQIIDKQYKEDKAKGRITK